MASLSDQIDRLTRNTRAIKITAQQIDAPHNQLPGTFTRAVLNTPLGNLIRDIDPSELGLFSLVDAPSNNAYEKTGSARQESGVKRTEFSGATPLRKHPSSRREDKQDIDPEIYAHAALKYVDKYQPIRPMPRAYDQIVAILNRLNAVRANIDSLSATLEQAATTDDAPPLKTRIELEEKRIKDLQARMAELSKKKEKESHVQRQASVSRKQVEQGDTRKVSISRSPQEDKFWNTPVGPSRTLNFADNLLDEEVDLNDVSTTSFQSPLARASDLASLKTFGDTHLVDDSTITKFSHSIFSLAANQDQEGQVKEEEELDAESMHSPATPILPPQPPVSVVADSMDKSEPKGPETPSTRQRKIRVNVEVERIISKIWSTVGDIIMPSNRTTVKAGSLSVTETISHLQQLATHMPQPDSPTASSASSMSVENSSLPTVQQIMTAHLLMILLSAPPHYSMSLNKVKEQLTLKAKGVGVSVVGQNTTRVLYGCVAKRLVKIDRGGGEQVVKFDI
ncbi:hypothetical protein B0H34DRAFT_795838 [Crassisporium funariophilum]|nr:hypothetical protein B0H34DRAFT_795838 [Crassisporium funariophilum]